MPSRRRPRRSRTGTRRSSRTSADQLDRLNASRSDESRLRPIVARLEDEGDAIDELRTARHDGDTELYRRALSRARANDAAWRVQAQAGGFTVCGTS